MGEADPPVLDYRTPKGDAHIRRRTRPWVLWTAGIIAGLVLLITLILPQLNHPHRERSNRIKCMSNLRAIGQAISLYRDDCHAWPQTLADILVNCHLSPEVFTCPSSNADKASVQTIREAALTLTNPRHCSYLYFPPPANVGDVDAETVLMVERMKNHENQGMNMLFGDGHTEWCSAKDAQFILGELKAGRNPPRWGTTPPATPPSSTPGTGGQR